MFGKTCFLGCGAKISNFARSMMINVPHYKKKHVDSKKKHDFKDSKL